MKYLLLIITFFTISCKAQIVSLETMAQCRQENPLLSCPDNWKYEKDINNSLDKYKGIWKGNYDGKIYEINLKKGLYQDLTLSGRKSDILIGRLRITDMNGSFIYNTFNELDDTKTNFSGLGLASNLQSYMMYFSGETPQGCINYGTVYLRMKPATPNQMSIFYLSDYDTVQGVCPSSFKTTIPEQKPITLTKQ